MTAETERAYDQIDRYLRNNLDDADYAEYSDALEIVLAASPAPAPEAPTEQWLTEAERLIEVYARIYGTISREQERDNARAALLSHLRLRPQAQAVAPKDEPVAWVDGAALRYLADPARSPDAYIETTLSKSDPEGTRTALYATVQAQLTDGGQASQPLPMPAPERPTHEQAMQALEWLYNHPRADAVTEYTAIRRFIERSASAAAPSVSKTQALTDEQIEALAVEHEAFGFGRVGDDGLLVHGFEPDGLRNFARALLAASTVEGQRDAADCEWTEEDPWGSEPGTYDSACGERWSFIDGGPKENNVRFCQGCGKPVKLIPFPEPVDEDAALSPTPAPNKVER